MAYFAPYIDGTGIHMPTYEERLEALTEAYRGIFGAGAELSAAAPDYQLLSVFARALDDVSALVLKAYNSRNPAYASGQALDLLLPQYGLTREAGETDASVRNRIRHALASRGSGSKDAILAAVRSDFDGYLIGGAADTSCLDLQLRHNVVHGFLESLYGRLAGFFLNPGKCSVHDLLGYALFAVKHDVVDQLGDNLVVVHGICQYISFL